ncbi:PREDICTED: uncharacterized protein LOC108763437 [Trachymyrmex cornetzi]|uniref:uncharacterized protein LOC108763437 n=1 Tax=Trachymyrmex cornetzi TaxID=471704 RepID=UPI00084F5988|nr:PREDICTED: uncharacterized protein LOC108763437 [Trachymyrmex cornetzi]
MEKEGETVLGAIKVQLREWVDERVGLTFRTTQVLSGHGCFGRFLCRIGRETSNRCWHCDSQNDTSRHILGYCPTWDTERAELKRKIGADLSLGAVIRAMLQEEKRHAVMTFCEEVMTRKEVAERARERGDLAT